jgi:anthranilate phosphoribosyltransferase
MKSETPEELLGFVEEGRARIAKIEHGRQGVLDCAGAYDGRGKSFAATIPTAAVLAALGVPVVLHGSRTLPPKYGVALIDILEELRVPIGTDPHQAGETLKVNQVAFLHTEAFLPALYRLRPIREQIGVRSLLNTVEKFLNPAQADFLIAGVFHSTALDKAAELMMRLGHRKGMVVQGVDGSEDVPVNRPAGICIISEGTADKRLIDPNEFGLKTDMEPVKLSPAEQAAGIVGVLQDATHPYRNFVLWNSAIRLWLVEKAGDLGEGIEMARTVLDDGRAWAAFQKWSR